MKVAVVGGGAAGLFCATLLTQNNLINQQPFCADKCDGNKIEVTLFEKRDRVGNKLLQTGNGRCNLSNVSHLENLDDFCDNYDKPDSVKELFSAFGVEKTLEIFQSLGLAVKVVDGLVYPLTDSASSVLDIFRLALLNGGVNVLCDKEIVWIEQIQAKGKNEESYSFCLKSSDGENYFFDRVVLCGGGKAGNVKGEAAYPLATMTGHAIVPLTPSLAPVKCCCPVFEGLNGVRVNCRVSLLKKSGVVSAVQEGELLIKDYGLSGICIFQLTAKEIDQDDRVVIDLFPSFDIFSALQKRKTQSPYAPSSMLFAGLLSRRIGENCLKALGYDAKTTIGQIDTKAVASFCKAITATRLQVLPFDKAQMTKGGVCCSQIDFSSMRSKVCRNLYLCGEMVDIAAMCGGYNLQFAWSCALAASYDILKSAGKTK